jgi:hypothetical protein
LESIGIDDWGILDSPFRYSEAGQKSFEAITNSLALSGLGIEELVIGSNTYGPSLPGVIHALAPSRSDVYQQAFWALKNLKILLPHAFNYSGMLALIHSAPLLEELELKSDTFGGETLCDDLFRSLMLPNLQSLTLDSLILQSPIGLVEFFRKYASTLRRVDFGKLVLETGSWESCSGNERTPQIELSEIIFLPRGSLAMGDRLVEIVYWASRLHPAENRPESI